MPHTQVEGNNVTQATRNFNSQSEFSTIQETNRNLLATGKLSDVTFVVGSEHHQINAHKLILMSRSIVFEAMFERWNPENSTVGVSDTTFEAFKYFLLVSYIKKYFVFNSNKEEVPNCNEAFFLLSKIYPFSSCTPTSSMWM